MNFLSARSKKVVIDRSDSLAGIPVFNEGINILKEKDGKVMISMRISHKKTGFWFRFMPRVASKRIKLDELGSFVISCIDGKKNVLQIIEKFIEHYGSNRREAELSIADFLKSLAKRQVISIVIK